MKKFKHGFTLAEVLLCVAIMSIVIVLGMKVTQNATQRAYDKYWTVGYENLYDVLMDIEKHHVEDSWWTNLKEVDKSNHGSLNHELNTYFSPHAAMTFEFKHLYAGSSNKGDTVSDDPGEEPVEQTSPTYSDQGDPVEGDRNRGVKPGTAQSRFNNNNDNWVETNNGIRYSALPLLNDSGATNTFIIAMSVPQPVTRNNNGHGTAFFLFIPPNNENIDIKGRYTRLIPISKDIADNFVDDESNSIIPDGFAPLPVDLQNSPLLRFTLNDGIPRTYNEAFCNRYTDGGNNGIPSIITCAEEGNEQGQMRLYKR